MFWVVEFDLGIKINVIVEVKKSPKLGEMGNLLGNIFKFILCY